jgi:hypothetical protein
MSDDSPVVMSVVRVLQLSIVAVLGCACGNPNVKRVEINGLDCRVDTSKLGGEACCETAAGWRRLDATGTQSSFVGPSTASCDPGNP